MIEFPKRPVQNTPRDPQSNTSRYHRLMARLRVDPTQPHTCPACGVTYRPPSPAAFACHGCHAAAKARGRSARDFAAEVGNVLKIRV